MTIQLYLTRYIILKVQSGEWPPEKKIFSERQLSIKFDTTTITVRKVLKKFAYSNILYSKPNVGYFVKPGNILSPGDTLGISKNDRSTTVKISKLMDFPKPIRSALKEYFKPYEIADLTILEKKEYFKKRLIKHSLIGIKEPRDEIIQSHKSLDFFSIRKFHAFQNNLIFSRKDMFCHLNSEVKKLFDMKVPSVAFISGIYTSEDRIIEVGITLIDLEIFKLDTHRSVV